jgi:hypothetical protein
LPTGVEERGTSVVEGTLDRRWAGDDEHGLELVAGAQVSGEDHVETRVVDRGEIAEVEDDLSAVVLDGLLEGRCERATGPYIERS